MAKRADLRISAGSVTGSFQIGGRVRAKATIKNQGQGSAGSSYVGYYLSTDSTINSSDTRLDYDYVSSLSAGRSGNEYEYFNLPTNLTAGKTYYIGALADYTGRVSESNEGNNGRVLKSFTVQAPDLVVTSGDVTGNLQAGGRVRAKATNYLEELEDLKVALNRLNDPTDAMISLEEMRAEVGLWNRLQEIRNPRSPKARPDRGRACVVQAGGGTSPCRNRKN
uniref:CARDB protein n=1 Tax=Candidatus Kentrum sp. FW TaxID=2126338 RepID=A0A450TXW6_9GAMM|nr:MAG: CARDB protein [Candidatus Kentron sp. FW]